MKNAFMEVKNLIGRDVPPYYPNFSVIIITYTYASGE